MSMLQIQKLRKRTTKGFVRKADKASVSTYSTNGSGNEEPALEPRRLWARTEPP